LAQSQFGGVGRSIARVSKGRSDCSSETGKRMSLRIRRGQKEIRSAAVLRFNKYCIDYWDLNTPVTPGGPKDLWKIILYFSIEKEHPMLKSVDFLCTWHSLQHKGVKI
jgi:hypothetical protein